MSAEEWSGEVVENFDDLWRRDSRQAKIGDVRLGDRGIPQRVLAYGMGALGLYAVLALFPLTGTLMGLLPWWTVMVCIGLGAGLGALGRLPELDVLPHTIAGPAFAHLLGPKTLLGWTAIPDIEGDWLPDELVIEEDGSRGYPNAVYTGPGTLIRHAPAHVEAFEATRFDRLLGRKVCQRELTQRPGTLQHPKAMKVPAGVRVRLHATGARG